MKIEEIKTYVETVPSRNRPDWVNKASAIAIFRTSREGRRMRERLAKKRGRKKAKKTGALSSALLLLIISLTLGCTSIQTDKIYQAGGAVISKSEARTAWFNSLAEDNPYLHAALLKAMFTSKAHGKRIYVYRYQIEEREVYAVSNETKQGMDVLSVEYDKKLIHFDHYGEKDGKSMDYFVDLTYVNDKIKQLHEELDIKEFN